MKTFLKLFAIAAAFGMAPAAALAAPAPAAPATARSAAPATASSAPAASDQSANSAAAAPAVAAPTPLAPANGFGQPEDRLGLQQPVSPIGVRGLWVHDWILMPLIVAISIFVLFLLLWVMFRYRRGANPVPTRNTHNTFLEIVWTAVPVLILVAIAVPSIDLLRAQ